MKTTTMNTITVAGTLRLHEVEDPQALADAVAQAVREAATSGIEARGRASLVVTGGTTPRDYYPRLAALDLPWDKLSLTLSDERWVAPTDAGSNEGLVRRLLLQGPAAAATLVPLFEPDATPEDAAPRIAARVSALPHPYDLVLLGLGADSHVASMFPGGQGTDAALDLASAAVCRPIVTPANIPAGPPRMTLVLAELLKSRRIVIAARGIDKREAFIKAATGGWHLPSPVHGLALHAKQPVDFYWCE